MGYTVMDLLDKLIAIEEKGCDIYKQIAASCDRTPVKTAAAVLAKEEERHREFYERMKTELAYMKDNEVSIELYDKAAALLHQFRNSLSGPETCDIKALLQFALSLEEQNLAILLTVQGRLVERREDLESVNYKVFSELIEEEKKHVRNLEMFVK